LSIIWFFRYISLYYLHQNYKNFPLVEIHNNEKESKWNALQNIRSRVVDSKPRYPTHFMIKDDIAFSEKDNRLLPLGLMSYDNFFILQ